MPEYENNNKGDLIIKFNIIYPDKIEGAEEIKKIINHPEYGDNDGINIEYYKNIYESSNEEHSETQCVQQ